MSSFPCGRDGPGLATAPTSGRPAGPTVGLVIAESLGRDTRVEPIPQRDHGAWSTRSCSIFVQRSRARAGSVTRRRTAFLHPPVDGRIAEARLLVRGLTREHWRLNPDAATKSAVHRSSIWRVKGATYQGTAGLSRRGPPDPARGGARGSATMWISTIFPPEIVTPNTTSRRLARKRGGVGGRWVGVAYFPRRKIK